MSIGLDNAKTVLLTFSLLEIVWMRFFTLCSPRFNSTAICLFFKPRVCSISIIFMSVLLISTRTCFGISSTVLCNTLGMCCSAHNASSTLLEVPVLLNKVLIWVFTVLSPRSSSDAISLSSARLFSTGLISGFRAESA